ncbi:MAG: hypothetical protein FJ189_13745 [Gammaproteobacteria bacterium]|nr:hypothetical protein [bacterium]MBM4202328.1 hypothetical protein [Gammaproteobacteria bacterium]
MGARRRVLALLSCIGMILAFLAGGGCVFTPRSPETPIDSDVEWLPPFEPENVLANMESAVEGRYLTNYKDSLGEEFVFTPSPLDVVEAPPSYFDGFGKTRELAALEKLFTQVTNLTVNWNYGEEDITVSGTEATFTLENYELVVTYANGDVVSYAGYAVLTLLKAGSQWRLVEWDESPSASNLSWGRLRANLDV